MSTYFLLDPFEFPYYFYRIRGELIYVLSIVVCIPSTFCPTLGHHYNNNFTTSTYKKPSSNNSCTLNFKSECPFRYKKAIIHNLISCAKLISSSKTIFYKEVENIKQALINNGFPNYIVDEQIKRMIKNVNQQNKHCTTPSSQQTYIKLFYRNRMHYNYKSDEKTLIHKNILPTDPNKKNKTYYIL